MRTVLEAGRYGIHLHSDGSGDVVVFEIDGAQVRVPFSLLVKAVAHVVRSEKIEAIEQASDEEIVGLE